MIELAGQTEHIGHFRQPTEMAMGRMAGMAYSLIDTRMRYLCAKR